MKKFLKKYEQEERDVIDVRSDTVTQPTKEMREAAFSCPVGDDVYRDDPTVNRLEERAAEILGKEAALFVTSGTQGNQTAIMTWTGRGDEILVSDAAHIYEHEVGAVAVRNISSATSPGRPSLSAGISCRRESRSSGDNALFMAVSMTPQAMALTWMLLGASSLARALVKALIPPLVAE